MKYKDLQDAMNLYGADQMSFYQKYSTGYSELKTAFSEELKKRIKLNTLDQHLTPLDIDRLCHILSQREDRMKEKTVSENYEGEAFELDPGEDKKQDTVKTNAVYRCLYKHVLHTYLHCPDVYQELQRDAISDTLRVRWEHRIQALGFYTKYNDEMLRTLLLQDQLVRLTDLDVKQGWVSNADFKENKKIFLPEFKILITQKEVTELIDYQVEIVAKIHQGVDATLEERSAAAMLLGDYYQSKEDATRSSYWYGQAALINDASPRQPDKG